MLLIVHGGLASPRAPFPETFSLAGPETSRSSNGISAGPERHSAENYFRDQGEAVDLPSLGPDFAIPVFVFQGALDNVAPVPPVRTYVDSITAPRKELVLIPGAGHNAIATKSDEFLALLIQRVRPLAAQ